MRRALAVLALTALTAGCAAMTVSSHIERGLDFSAYATYDWGTADSLPVGDPRLDNNAMFRDYVQGAIEKMLAARGYALTATPGEADLLVHYHASVNQKVDIYNVDYGRGYCQGNCEPRVVEYDEGTLVIDLVDRRTYKVIWRGWAQDAVDGVIDNQERLESQVDEGVSRMMQRLPRGGAAVR